MVDSNVVMEPAVAATVREALSWQLVVGPRCYVKGGVHEVLGC
jgi:hypothetical protein